MARKGHTKVIYKGTFICKQTLDTIQKQIPNKILNFGLLWYTFSRPASIWASLRFDPMMVCKSLITYSQMAHPGFSKITKVCGAK